MSRSWDARGIADARVTMEVASERFTRLRAYLRKAGDPDDVTGVIAVLRLDLDFIESVAIEAGNRRDLPRGAA